VVDPRKPQKPDGHDERKRGKTLSGLIQFLLRSPRELMLPDGLFFSTSSFSSPAQLEASLKKISSQGGAHKKKALNPKRKFHLSRQSFSSAVCVNGKMFLLSPWQISFCLCTFGFLSFAVKISEEICAGEAKGSKSNITRVNFALLLAVASSLDGELNKNEESM
jgi:hypothetical protein